MRRFENHFAGFLFLKGLAEEMGSELLIARFLKKTERVLACFVRLSKSRLAIPSTPPKRAAHLRRELPVQQEGVQTNGDSTERSGMCQMLFAKSH
jgi:hypothetical protein